MTVRIEDRDTRSDEGWTLTGVTAIVGYDETVRFYHPTGNHFEWNPQTNQNERFDEVSLHVYRFVVGPRPYGW